MINLPIVLVVHYCQHQPIVLQQALVLQEYHNLRLVAQHILVIFGQIQAQLDNVVTLDNLLDIANIDCKIYQVERYRLHHHCKVLKDNFYDFNLISSNSGIFPLILFYDASGIRQHFLANHNYGRFHCTVDHRCIIVPLRFRSSKSNNAYTMSRDQIFHRANHNGPLILVRLKIKFSIIRFFFVLQRI